MVTLIHIIVGIAIAGIVPWALNEIPESWLRKTNRLVFHPERYHGHDKTHRFFEGWYFKLVRNNNVDVIDDGPRAIAVVPGIFLGDSKNSVETHAFVFVTIDGKQQHYYRFDAIKEFDYSTSGGMEDFYIRVGNNIFTQHGISLDLQPRDVYDDDASLTLYGNLTFHNPSPWPVSFFHLGAMGPVGWLMSLLECSHGVLSFDHTIQGSLNMLLSSSSSSSPSLLEENDSDNESGTEEEDRRRAAITTTATSIPFDGGYGYTEKDHGRSFPELWIWIQTNSFRNNPGTSLFFSAAKIPFMGMAFPGFTAAVYHDQTLIPFATYNQPKTKFQTLQIEKDRLIIVLVKHRYRLELTVHRKDVSHVMLYAPVNFTRMAPFVNEALNATVHMRLFQTNENDDDELLIIDDVGDHAGLEVHGNVEYLVENLCGKPNANKLICL